MSVEQSGKIYRRCQLKWNGNEYEINKSSEDLQTTISNKTIDGPKATGECGIFSVAC
jgi:hypothetical protein